MRPRALLSQAWLYRVTVDGGGPEQGPLSIRPCPRTGLAEPGARHAGLPRGAREGGPAWAGRGEHHRRPWLPPSLASAPSASRRASLPLPLLRAWHLPLHGRLHPGPEKGLALRVAGGTAGRQAVFLGPAPTPVCSQIPPEPRVPQRAPHILAADRDQGPVALSTDAMCQKGPGCPPALWLGAAVPWAPVCGEASVCLARGL